MWKFSNSNSNYNLWPPDTAQQQKPISSINPQYANNSVCFSENSMVPFPGFGAAQGSCLHLNSAFTHQLNSQALNPAIGSLGLGVSTANGSLGLGLTTRTRKFLIFDQSGDRTSLIFNSVANSQTVWNPNLPATNATYAYTFNDHDSEEREEMHEDTEEINALLYSDSEYSYDSEEASTGHSPLCMEEEKVSSSPIPSKRRRVDFTELDASVMDTASSARVPSRQLITNDNDDDAEVSYVDSGSKLELEDNAGHEIECSKRKRIQTTVNVLRRIIPGGKGKGTAAVLDEAIRYLKSLKVQAKYLGVTHPHNHLQLNST